MGPYALDPINIQIRIVLKSPKDVLLVSSSKLLRNVTQNNNQYYFAHFFKTAGILFNMCSIVTFERPIVRWIIPKPFVPRPRGKQAQRLTFFICMQLATCFVVHVSLQFTV